MKKILYLMMAVVALSFVAISCDDDDETYSFSTTPEKAAAGTYVGTYLQIQDGTTDSVYNSGMVVITPTDSVYCADVNFVSEGFSLDESSVTNITHANNGFSFHNFSSNNASISSFSGTIDGNGYMQAYFKIVQTEGRKSYTYHYYFNGTKQ